MKKVICAFLVSVFWVLLSSVIFAGYPTSIYFCTRDVAEYESKNVPSDKSVASKDLDFVWVYERDSILHKHKRHCFVLMAKEHSLDDGRLEIEITKGNSPCLSGCHII